MRLATIDCGTNTVLLLVADVATGGGARAVLERMEITRLGEGLDRTALLREEAMARTLTAMQAQAAAARAAGAEHIAVVGTESLRAARNGAEFLGRAAAAGLPVRVLCGEEEARLAWRAVLSSLPLAPGATRSVLDIGGGSTELVVGVGGEPHPRAHRSVPIGSVRLTERLLLDDPPTPPQRRALREAVAQALGTLPPPAGELVGVAGTVTTLAALHLGMSEYHGHRVEGLRLPVAALRDLVEHLGSMTLAERRRLPGLAPRRADVIYAGGVILLSVCECAGASDLLVSDRGVRWGALLALADELRSNSPSAGRSAGAASRGHPLTPDKERAMRKYRCIVCGHVYDPELGDPDSGIPPGTPFEDIIETWVCPDCGASKADFEPMDE